VTFEVTIDAETRTVRVASVQGRFEATLDGRSRVVDVARAGEIWSLLIGPAEADHYDRNAGAAQDDRPAGESHDRVDRVDDDGANAALASYEVAFGEDVAGERELYVNGRRVIVRTAALHRGAAAWRRGGRTAASRPDAASGGPVTVAAPMPGRIVKVLVKVGETVAARQGLVVVEAMKMENELRSPRAGIVSDVRVTEGALVDAKAALVVIE
jgi:biotin carboxyl carrier protein